MNKINKGSGKTPKKANSKNKWREIEEIRDRYALMKELQEDDHNLDIDIEELGI
jgi:hypothetical protein